LSDLSPTNPAATAPDSSSDGVSELVSLACAYGIKGFAEHGASTPSGSSKEQEDKPRVAGAATSEVPPEAQSLVELARRAGLAGF